MLQNMQGMLTEACSPNPVRARRIKVTEQAQQILTCSHYGGHPVTPQEAVDQAVAIHDLAKKRYEKAEQEYDERFKAIQKKRIAAFAKIQKAMARIQVPKMEQFGVTSPFPMSDQWKPAGEHAEIIELDKELESLNNEL